MAKRFEGKVAVVTGGNSGIGLATAKAFAREGARVAITGRDETTLAAALKELGPGHLAIRSDASKLEEIDRAVGEIKKKFDRVDALFVNAGIARFVPLLEFTEAHYDEMMDVNLKGLYFTIQKTVPIMNRGGAIVLNASISGHFGMQGASVYGATKAAVINLAQTLSADLLDRGIRVNVVSPGPITTELWSRMGMPDEELRQTTESIRSKVPLARFGTPEEVASAVLYLSSPESSFVVGTELLVDGGRIQIL